MVDSRQKGARAESDAKKVFKQYTGLNWERTPSSGALKPEHMLKGDLYIPGEKNLFTVEVKHFKDCAINHLLLTGKSPLLLDWWSQTVRESGQNNNEPLLVFKFDRSKWFVVTEETLKSERFLSYKYNNEGDIVYIGLLEPWLQIKRNYIK